MEKDTSASKSSPTGNGELTPQQAIERLIQAVYIGQTRGAWKLEEVPELLRAIKVFTTNSAQSSTKE